MDLDQTTMIGSALDLDSLEGDSKQNNAAQVRLINFPTQNIKNISINISGCFHRRI